MTSPKKQSHPLATVGGLAGAAGGWALSHYCGMAAWIPGIAAILLLVLFAKTSVRPKWFTGAIAVTGAHVIWFIIGSVSTGIWAATILDIIVLSAGIVWLWLRPGIGAALFLGIVHLVSLGMNVIALTSAAVGDVTHRALTAHCAFRVIAIVCLGYGFIRMRRAVATRPPAAADSTT